MFRIAFLGLLSFSLVAQVNSPYDEQSPVLHPAKNEIYFTIASHPLNVAGKRDPGDIWVSKREGDTWSLPAPIKGLVNNAAYNAVLGFSENGDEMYLFGHYTSRGDVSSNQGISVSKRNGDTWSVPENKRVPYFMNKSVTAGGQISGNVFVFSGEGRTFDSFGNEDIYVCFNREGLWTEPLNLGNTINTIGQELSPYYQASTSTLFFSSNKPGGMGSFDVYSCERLDDSWQKWSIPKNIGPTVNTEGRELYFRLVLDGYVYTSTLNSDGYGDIRETYSQAAIQANSQTTTNVVELQEPENVIPTDAENAKGITLTGRITDAVTGQGIVARFSIKPQDQPPVNSALDGQYKAFLSLGLDYSVNIVAPGYIALDEPIIVPDKSVRDLEINFKLQPVAVGVSVNLKHVLFRQSSPELLPESYDELDRVVTFLNDNPTVIIELSGHTDDAGKAALNLKLSRDRVARVKNYLTEKGIVASRVKGVGYGETKPIASNKTDEGRKMNRRVEFKILKK
jgi:OOP family OmpA-OmpF porin